MLAWENPDCRIRRAPSGGLSACCRLRFEAFADQNASEPFSQTDKQNETYGSYHTRCKKLGLSRIGASSPCLRAGLFEGNSHFLSARKGPTDISILRARIAKDPSVAIRAIP